MKARQILAPAALALVCAVPAAAQENLRLATFDSVWSIVHRMHFDSTFGGLDWNKVRVELRPKAEQAKNNAEIRTVLQEMITKLGQSHYSIIPKEASDDKLESDGQGDVGFDVRYIEDKIVVTKVDSGGPAAAAGIKTGWVLKRIDARKIEDVLERARRLPVKYAYPVKAALVTRALLIGAEDSKVELQFADARNRTKKVEVTRRQDPGQPVKFMSLPTMFTRFSSRAITHQGDQIGVLWFNVWMVPAMLRFDSAVDRLRGSRGMIVDLRGNPGGAGAMSMGVAGHFMDTAQAFGSMTSRTNKLQFKANPRRSSTVGERVKPFAGPVAVLMDELSASTSEVFAGGLQSIGRARVFGSRSMGAVLPAYTTKLPNGDALYHAIADFVTADGTLLEGRGVVPDEQIVVKRADLLAGRDPVLEAALRWIAAEARAHQNAPRGTYPSEKKQ